MYFSEYGELDWLEPTEFYDGPWSYTGFAEGADGEPYDLVRNLDTMEMRYTSMFNHSMKYSHRMTGWRGR